MPAKPLESDIKAKVLDTFNVQVATGYQLNITVHVLQNVSDYRGLLPTQQ